MKFLTNKEYDRLIREAYDKGYNAGNYQIIPKNKDVEIANATVLFDFNNPAINVYSVERDQQHNTEGLERTVICFVKQDGNFGTWYTFCSRQMHEELVLQFGDYLNSKETKKNKFKK